MKKVVVIVPDGYKVALVPDNKGVDFSPYFRFRDLMKYRVVSGPDIAECYNGIYKRILGYTAADYRLMNGLETKGALVSQLDIEDRDKVLAEMDRLVYAIHCDLTVLDIVALCAGERLNVPMDDETFFRMLRKCDRVDPIESKVAKWKPKDID